MKQRFLDTLKMIGVCMAVIFFFAFLVHSCDDDEDSLADYEELREQVWDEAYHEGFGDGVSEAYAGNAFVVDEHYLKVYDEGYSDGYSAGYSAALDEYARSAPDPTPSPTVRPASTPQPTTAPSADDFTVYVSNSGTMHKKSNCSGMKHYTEMPYSVASQYYTKKCSNCFK